MRVKDLKPCPFCGNEDVNLIYGEDGFFVHSIKCEYCNCELPVDTEDLSEAVKQWNDRYEATTSHEITYDEAVNAIPPGVYKHYEGGMYRVKGIAFNKETNKPVVIYTDYYEQKTYCRSVENFTEEVTRKRFKRMEDTQS